MLTLLIANLIILPVAISFFYDDLRAHWIVFNSVSDAVFIADIAVKFRTGEYPHAFRNWSSVHLHHLLPSRFLCQHFPHF